MKQISDFIEELRLLLVQPQHSIPDIIIWMISGGKRIGYARVPAEDVLYSDEEILCGLKSGIIQTVFLQLPSFKKVQRFKKLVQAKLEIRLWLGKKTNDQDYLARAPTGYSLPNNIDTYPTSLIYNDASTYILRAYMYQARTVLGADESGLSDPFARVMFGHSMEETRIIKQTRTPVWNQMFSFKDIVLYGRAPELISNPPVIVIGIYDKDEGEQEEFIGRTIALPSVIKGLYHPVKLAWLPIKIGNDKVGELLAAFELFPVCIYSFFNTWSFTE